MSYYIIFLMLLIDFHILSNFVPNSLILTCVNDSRIAGRLSFNNSKSVASKGNLGYGRAML